MRDHRVREPWFRGYLVSLSPLFNISPRCISPFVFEPEVWYRSSPPKTDNTSHVRKPAHLFSDGAIGTLLFR